MTRIDRQKYLQLVMNKIRQCRMLLCKTSMAFLSVFTWKRLRICLWILSGLTVVFGGLQITGRMISQRARNEFNREMKNRIVDRELDKKAGELEKKIKKESPKGFYLVIDTAQNTLTLRKNDNIIHEARVSCGSGNILEESDSKRRWIFDTPRGEFTVQYKLKDPVWIKPDWAFIEEGTAIPKSRQERIETGVLGDFALGFGNGFFIHGTLYTRLLGRSVTHGCVRVGDDDLALLYRKVPIGTRIFIY